MACTSVNPWRNERCAVKGLVLSPGIGATPRGGSTEDRVAAEGLSRTMWRAPSLLFDALDVRITRQAWFFECPFSNGGSTATS